MKSLICILLVITTSVIQWCSSSVPKISKESIAPLASDCFLMVKDVTDDLKKEYQQAKDFMVILPDPIDYLNISNADTDRVAVAYIVKLQYNWVNKKLMVTCKFIWSKMVDSETEELP